MISWRRIKLCRYYMDGKSTVNRLTWYGLNAPVRRIGSEEHAIKRVALSSLGCPNVCLSYAPMSRDKPYIFWKLLVQGYQNWYHPVHMMKWQKNLTYDICLKREIFKDTKINMYHLWPETILLQQHSTLNHIRAKTPIVFANVVYLCYKIGEHQIEPRQCE